MSEGWRFWLQWQRVVAPENLVEIQAVETDQGEWLGYLRVIGRLRANAKLEEPITSISTPYVRQPLLREGT